MTDPFGRCVIAQVCRNKLSQTGGFKQQKFILSQSGGQKSEAEVPAVRGVGSSGGAEGVCPGLSWRLAVRAVLGPPGT